jgi:SAM-dependent methyltransferase
MPTSDSLNIPAVLHAVTSFEPKSILDVGCGFGKYGALLREYTDVAARRYPRQQWQVKIVGIDGYEGYCNPLWDAVYTEVHVGEAMKILPTLGDFDVVLIADVIEHFEKPQAEAIVKASLAKCKALVISTPHDFYPQGAEFENEYERHRCLWTAADTPPGYHCHTIPLLACDVFVITKQPLLPAQLYPTNWTDLMYLRSRRNLRKLGFLARPLSMIARFLNRITS